MLPSRCALAGTMIALLAAFAPARAQAQLMPFALRHWTTADGLPSHSINGIVEGPKGYLWLATQGGLVRYDGQRFVLVSGDGVFAGNRFHALFVDASGRLLVSGADDRLYRLGERGFELIGSGLTIRALGEQADGTLWGGNTAVQARLSPDGQWVGRRPAPNLDVIDSLTRFVQSGNMMNLTAVRRVLQPATGRVFVAQPAGDGLVMPAGDGSAWRIGPAARAELRLVDREGRLWVSGPGTLSAYIVDRPDPVARIELPGGGRINAVYEGSDGALWIGSDTNGLFRGQEAAVVTHGRAQGTRDDVIHNIALRSDGRVALGDASGADFVVADDGRLAASTPAGFQFADRDGWNWHLVSSASRTELLGIRGSRSRRYVVPGPLLLRPRRFIAPDGAIWIGGADWLGRFDPVRAPDSPWTLVVRGFKNLMAVSGAADGSVLMLSDAGIEQIAGADRAPLVRRDDLPPGELRALYAAQNGDLWVGTYGKGLVRIRGTRIQRVTQRDGLSEDIVANILEDGMGGLWTAGNQGIQRVSLRELDAFLDGELPEVAPLVLTRLADLGNPEASGWQPAVDRAGRLWFPTFGGAVAVDPVRAVAGTAEPPRVVVESVHEGRRLEVTYTAIALTGANQVRFQYRLEGVDAGWIDARRARSAVYNDMPPGTRRFLVRAARAGEWSEPVAVSVIVKPFWWETTLARLVGVVLLFGLVAGVGRWRARRLRARAADLERQVEMRTEQLRLERERVAEQAQRLQQLVEARSQFFANISHEFRTPLTLLQGPLADIAAGDHGPVSDTARGLLRLAQENAARLLRLVDQLLDLSKAESGRLQLHAREVELCAFTRGICESFETGAVKAGIALRVTTPPGEVPIWVDADHLEKVLVNLVANALKYTDAGGRVDVEIASGADAAGDAIISVRDTGIGIAEADLPHVFERYFRGASSTPGGARAGTGIGLAIVRQLVELHQGAIDVESRPGQGSVFTVRLPRGEGHSRAERAAAGNAGAEQAATVGAVTAAINELPTLLIADDSADIRQYLRQSLAGRFRLIEAQDGLQALELVRAELPDLVVSDVMMPGLDGFGLCRAIKADPETEFVPVVLLTARASTDSKVAGIGHGADDYLVKPFNVRELVARITNLIDQRRRWLARQPEDAVRPAAPAAATPASARTDPFMTDFRAAIEARLAEEGITPDTLAADLKVSRATLYRRVEQATGKSPMDVVWDLRLDRAAQLLAGSGTVAEIAYGLGFTSLSHFSRRFRAKFDMSPSAWRSK